MNAFTGTWSGDRLLNDSTGMPLQLDVPPPPDAYFPIDFTNLYLGIDDSDEKVAQVVCLDGAATRLPRPICSRSFKNPAKLLAYVKSWIRASGSLHVALTKPNRVSGPVTYFLEQLEGIPVTRLSEAETLPYEESWETDHIDRQFIEAYCLALTLAYRVSTTTVLDDVRHMANDVEVRLNQMKRKLDRLIWAIRVPF